mmetsp:Transcript_11703/g.17643  ORF Transcript_11703/g.17643 Transcript_11703/m.17643 type:complete len:741 (-) Transcript_11703:268-2490(-)|eukprot:CAMPEP_0196820228 /NCGR_PEP_ID=MMETSP1362-20130617/74307_1 /TAXON_ID=163516 /ORGANISM="Leptocylindrus danicus, Strain CCMP1856" /LENGTH=740 /DNA_ID=CAMNT_0042199017 /DNA_START=114 /DNA_END=2336 /DNA_ORIENTATION=+
MNKIDRNLRHAESHDIDDNFGDATVPDSFRGSINTLSSKAYTETSHSSNVWNMFFRNGGNVHYSNKDSVWKSKNSIDKVIANDDGTKLGDDMDEMMSCGEWMRWNVVCMVKEICHYVKTALSRPVIALMALGVFIMLFLAGFAIVQTTKSNYEDDLRFQAMCTAAETGQWFNDMFKRALLPLYSIQQAVIYSDYFRDLPQKIGKAGEPGSAPTLEESPNPKYSYRNVTNICDDAEMQAKFHEMVESVNHDTEMDGLIVHYRLAPHAVFCLVDPLVNDEDFGEGQSMDFSGAIGRDLLHSNAFWDKTVRATINSPGNEVDIFGPIEIAKGDDVIMPELYCGHLKVNMPGYELEIDGDVYESWGFVMHFIHWSKLKEQSKIYDSFSKRGVEFNLTRTDVIVDPATGEETAKVEIIAQSDNAHLLDDSNSEVVPIKTPNGIWMNRVGYPEGYTPSWYGPAIIGVAFSSFIIALMFAVILVEKQLHTKLLYKMMPSTAIKKLNRGKTVVEKYNLVTIFFSDIVGFTSMAGEMQPIQVMKMLNDLYVEFDKIVERHNLYKVETIGDAYMVVGGAPDRCTGPEAAAKVARFALEATKFVKNYRTSTGTRIYIRVGLHSGPVMAGVVGQAMPRYCLFGDTVNYASRMESTSVKMMIQCSDMTRRLLIDAPNHMFHCEERRGEDDEVGVMVKGKGLVHTWWIKGCEERSNATYDLDLENLGVNSQLSSRNSLSMVEEEDDRENNPVYS